MLSEPTSHLWYFVISMAFSLPSSDFLSSVLKHQLTGRKMPSYLLSTIIMSAPFTMSTIRDWNSLQGYSRGDLILLCRTPPTDQSPRMLLLWFIIFSVDTPHYFHFWKGLVLTPPPPPLVQRASFVTTPPHLLVLRASFVPPPPPTCVKGQFWRTPTCARGQFCHPPHHLYLC